MPGTRPAFCYDIGMRRLSIFFILLVAIAAFWIGSRYVVWQRFQNSALPFYFRYPPGWIEEDLRTGDLDKVILVRLHSKRNKRISMQVTNKTVADRPTDEAVLQETEESLRRNFPVFVMIDRITIKVQNTDVPFLHFRYKTLDMQEDIEQYLGLLWNKETVYYVITQASPDEFKEHAPTFQRLIGSIGFR
jgi:hypothetical protein